MSCFRLQRLVLSGLVSLCAGSVGCTPTPTSSYGFTLPEGNREIGETTFVELNCHQCHSVADTDLPVVENREMSIRLGGEVPRIGTYGELVTAIINPSHRLAKGHFKEQVSDEGKSKMKNYNEILTVKQLSDLVAFLQSRYKIRTYEPTHYPVYYLRPAD